MKVGPKSESDIMSCLHLTTKRAKIVTASSLAHQHQPLRNLYRALMVENENQLMRKLMGKSAEGSRTKAQNRVQLVGKNSIRSSLVVIVGTKFSPCSWFFALIIFPSQLKSMYSVRHTISHTTRSREYIQ